MNRDTAERLADPSAHQRGVTKLQEYTSQETGTAATHLKIVEDLAEIAPDVGKYIVDFGYGEIYSRPGLTNQQRALVTIASLTTQGTEREIELHVNTGLTAGLTSTEIVESIIHLIPYTGFPRVLNALYVVKQVFEQRQVQIDMTRTRPTMSNRQIRLIARPQGMPTVDDFELVETPLPQIRNNQFLVRNTMLSIDPYMRGRMNAGESYAPRVELGQVMEGHTVGEVVESLSPDFAVGDKVWLTGNWQDYSVGQAPGARKIDPALTDAAWLGPMGLPGWTAHYGLFQLGVPAAGETLVVSSAAGAVGGLVGQLARAEGLRVVGIAGGPDKCAYVTDELGFDACVDYKAADFARQLAKACPNGIDVDFENAGGKILDCIWPLLNPHGRVVVCGLSAQYNLAESHRGPDMTAVVKKRLRVLGFIIGEHPEYIPRAIDDLASRLVEERIRWRADITQGLENAPAAFLRMLNGANLGKTLVQLS